MNMHDENEICLIQNDYDDPFNTARVDYYGIGAWPTVIGNGVNDTWPLDCIEDDLASHAATPSPLSIFIEETGMGAFTATVIAEEDIIGGYFFMVATLDEEVPSSSGMSHLPHHVKVYMTQLTGDPINLFAGNSLDISHTFEVQADWDYDLMGVAAWVSTPGGTNPSPCSYGPLSHMNQVLNSRWVPAGGPVAQEQRSWGSVKSLFR
jgi:hypothetical protein